MSLRRLKPSDSLDLLLDTMCNTFGGIVLIALLVTLVAREAKLSEAAARLAADSAEVVQQRLEQAQRELAAAQQFATDLAQQRQVAAAGAKLELVVRRQALRQEHTRLQEALREAGQQLAAARDTAARQRAELGQLRSRLDALEQQRADAQRLNDSLQRTAEQVRAQVLQTEARAASATEARIRTLRLPREHGTQKRPWEIVVRHGAVYPVHVMVGGGQRDRNTTSLQWEETGDGAAWVEPLRGMGMNLQRAPTAFKTWLRTVPAQGYYLVFRVYADSFSVFNQAKQMALEEGYELTWVPYENSVRLKAGAGSTPPPPL